MPTNTRSRLGARSREQTTATAAARANLVSVAETLAALLPALAVLGLILFSLASPTLAFVLLGVPAAVAFGVALAFGVARAGAELAGRL
ncbi:hypothetical protein [Halobacterium zhouii]|uniref:hypothetical protein n=1 Tax=Halobacterium zhouii TaxID=2902624 RepID=UPI001E4A01C3|nr:hypothetical protein [Halobacterium zhouii]